MSCVRAVVRQAIKKMTHGNITFFKTQSTISANTCQVLYRETVSMFDVLEQISSFCVLWCMRLAFVHFLHKQFQLPGACRRRVLLPQMLVSSAEVAGAIYNHGFLETCHRSSESDFLDLGNTSIYEPFLLSLSCCWESSEQLVMGNTVHFGSIGLFSDGRCV